MKWSNTIVSVGTMIMFIALLSSANAQSDKPLSSKERGRALVNTYQCVACHVINGKGPKDGVSLDKSKRLKKFIVDQLLDPEGHVSKNAAAFHNEPNLMPSHQFSRAEAESIADYLISKDRRTPKGSKTTTSLTNKQKTSLKKVLK
jgi:cytochrome c